MSWNSAFLDVTLARSMRVVDGKARQIDGSTAMVMDGLQWWWWFGRVCLVIAMPQWNDIAATHNKNDSRVV
jgi:hypothetical protein